MIILVPVHPFVGENNWTDFLFWSIANEGMKVIAVRRIHQAEKKWVCVGDTLISCNNQN